MSDYIKNALLGVIAVALLVSAGAGVKLASSPASPEIPAQLFEQRAAAQSPVTCAPSLSCPSQAAPNVVIPSSQGDQLIGGLVHNIQETFDEGIAVDGTEVISGTGQIKPLAGLDITGNVTSTDLITTDRQSFTSVSTSQSLCSFRNNTGSDRLLAGAFPVVGYVTTTVTGGTFRVTISQSSTANATGTGSQLYYDNVITVPTNGVRNVSNTSTLSSVADVWKAGNYLNVLIASPTSTLSGFCTAPSS